MGEPKIIIGGQEGHHNTDLDVSRQRLDRAGSYRDLSTVIVIPTRGQIAARVVESWMGLMTPMNQKWIRMMVIGMEVGAAYHHAIETILSHPELQNWKYVLTLEEDNIVPADGLLKLYESIGDHAAVGGLYWTKGEGGQPMIYGDRAQPLNFIPQPPQPDTVQPAWGLGMGFTLFKLDVFKDEQLEKPYFETVQRFEPGNGFKAYSQDLHFYERIGKLGYTVACDTKVKVGHYDQDRDLVW